MGLFLRLLPFLLIALLVVIPTRRLFLAGWPRSYLLAYFLIVVGLGAIVAELEVAARYLVPILVIAYIAPFVTAGEGIARLIGRRAGGGQASDAGPVVRRVTPTVLPPTIERTRRSGRPGPGADDRSAGYEGADDRSAGHGPGADDRSAGQGDEDDDPAEPGDGDSADCPGGSA